MTGKTPVTQARDELPDTMIEGSKVLAMKLISASIFALALLGAAQAADTESFDIGNTVAANCDVTDSPPDTELSSSQPVGALVGIGTLTVVCNYAGPWQIRFGSQNGNYLVNETVPTYKALYATAWAGFGGTGCCGFQPPGAPGSFGPWYTFSGTTVTGTYSVRLDEAIPNVAGRYSDVQYIEVSP